MQLESQCRFCAKLPVVHNHRAGMATRCPLCKGQLVEDRGSGTTYRYEDPPEGPPQPKSLGRKLAALFGISASVLLVWLLVKPHAPETVVAAQVKPVVQDREIAQAAEVVDPVADESPRLAIAKSGEGMAELSAKPPAGEREIASKPYSHKGVAKNRPLYADGFYSRVKEGKYRQFADDALARKIPWKTLTESELLVELQAMPEAGLVPKFESSFEEKKKKPAVDHATYLADLKRVNPQAQGLPFLLTDCQLATSAIRDFQVQAVTLRMSLDALSHNEYGVSQSARRGLIDDENLRNRYNRLKQELFDHAQPQEASPARQLPKEKAFSGNVAVLQQIMMDQDKVIRRVLISYLEECKERKATVSLARMALFDLDADNRMRAVQSLKTRSAEDYTPVLLEGLRYPWPSVAHNAALALVRLKRSDLVPELAVALNQPDPDLPFTEAGVSKVRELIRVNHHRNCLMCHAPSYSERDPVRVSIPSPDRPLPKPFSVNEYCSDSSLAVRPDVTYLRQDFSTLLEVPDPGKWRSSQRFDFLVRVREVKREELAAFKNRPEVSEYKTAVLFALQELTGPYLETAVSAWTQRVVFGALETGK